MYEVSLQIMTFARIFCFLNFLSNKFPKIIAILWHFYSCAGMYDYVPPAEAQFPVGAISYWLYKQKLLRGSFPLSLHTQVVNIMVHPSKQDNEFAQF